MKNYRHAFCGYCHKQGVSFHIHSEKTEWELDDSSGSNTHYLLRCGQCSNIFYMLERENSEWDSEEIDDYGRKIWVSNPRQSFYPPEPKRPSPAWFWKVMQVDRLLYFTMHETYCAYDNDLRILCVSGIRTALDRLFTLSDISPDLPYARRVAAFKEKKRISPEFADAVDVMIEAGHAAIHRNWRPSEVHTSELLGYLDKLVEYCLFPPEGASVDALKKLIPPGPRKAAP